MTTLAYVLVALSLGVLIGFFLRKSKTRLIRNSKKESNSNRIISNHQVADVADFYNQYNQKFLAVYGEVIQAFRTKDVSKLLDYQIGSMEMESDQLALDAGCGICGPACYFAKQVGLKIEAITVSEVQVEKAKALIDSNKVQHLVNVQLGDFHQLTNLYPAKKFDLVYFLESFGHAIDHNKVLSEAWQILKPGGTLYIKDLFKRIAPIKAHQQKIDNTISEINKAYRYNIAELNEVLDKVRSLGFIITALKTIDIKLEDFENLTISNEFQELTGIGKIDDWESYIFPIEFYELKCYKPVHNLEQGKDKYFLQNMMYMQLNGLKQEEL